MNRRHFLHMAAVSSAALAKELRNPPAYQVVSKYHKEGTAGMPGLYPGRVTSTHHSHVIDPGTEKIDPEAVREMLRQGMLACTGDKDPRDAWARFIQPHDVVGIKINASGAPKICSSPEVVGEIAANLVKVGVKPENIWVYERFRNQVDSVNYKAFLPKGANIATADSYLGYDPYTFVEVNFFGEEDTRSNITRLVSDKLTKIINVPNMKDHSASGVTGCLKNIAYGSFSNVARSHYDSVTNTLTLIGTLASVEPLRSRTVLNIMDGIKGVWHAGPFSVNPKFRFFPGKIMVGTDPVAMDHILLGIIEEKRKQEHARSVWDAPKESIDRGDRVFQTNPNTNLYYREPGHIEYAGKLGLGVYDLAKIKLQEIEVG